MKVQYKVGQTIKNPFGKKRVICGIIQDIYGKEGSVGYDYQEGDVAGKCTQSELNRWKLGTP